MQPQNSPELSAVQLQKVDEICNVFEQAFKDGNSPVAEDFLDGVVQEVRTVLLPELIRLEKHYRPNCSTAEFSRRFPEVEHSWLKSLEEDVHAPQFPAIPGYFIIEELGRGGMGVVYLAADLNLHRQVALKMMHQSSNVSVEHRRRFLTEARAAARLQHPNLVQIYDSGEFEGHPFLVFELVDGGTLAEKIRVQPLTDPEAAELLETLSRALQFAHDRHIIHRDLKPSNILLGSDGVARISDFGLAKRLDDDVTQTISGVVVGTPSYMAPEQAAGLSEASSPAVDVYSLGAILYELLTGEPVFKAASVMETLELLRTQSPVPPRRIRKSIPRDLETICLKCLQREPERRYISAQVLADEIGRFRRGESIIARPVSTVERAGRWCLRHPLPASLAAALIAVVAISFVAIAQQRNEAVAQGRLAEENAAKYRAERDSALAARADAVASAAEADTQKSIAEEHQAAAESRFEKAQAPIQQLIRLGTELVRQPQMEAQGREALKKANEFRQALLEEKSEDPDVRLATATTLRKLAWTYLEFGQFADAENAYQQTLELLQERNGEYAGNSTHKRRLLQAHSELATALTRQQKYESAAIHSRTSLDYAELMVQMRPESPSARNTLGNCLTNHASALYGTGKAEEGLNALTRAVDVLRKLYADQPNTSGARANLALVMSNLAGLRWSTDPEAAESLALEALELRRAEVSHAKAPREEVMYLIRSDLQLSEWYGSTERLDEAEALLSEAMEHGLSVRKAFPGFYGTREVYIDALSGAHILAVKQADNDRAVTLLKEMREEIESSLKEFPNDAALRRRDAFHCHQWALHLAKTGEPSVAMELLMSSLRDLKELQLASSTPEQYRRDIITIARAARTIGTRFEFEEEKLAAVREWVDQDPTNSAAHNAFAWRLVCVKDSGLRDAVSAEKSIRYAIELKAGSPYFHNTLGTVLYYQNRLDEAAAAFERSLELKTPMPAADWCFLAMIHIRNEMPEKARELLEQAEDWQRKNRPEDEELLAILDEARSLPGMQPTSEE